MNIAKQRCRILGLELPDSVIALQQNNYSNGQTINWSQLAREADTDYRQKLIDKVQEISDRRAALSNDQLVDIVDVEENGPRPIFRIIYDDGPENGTLQPDILHCLAVRLVKRPSRNPLRTASRSQRDSGSRLVVRGGGNSRNLFNSSAIGGFL